MEEYDRAKRAAASLVSSRMYTCREVEERLRRKKISRDVAEQVVSDFVAAGILNDAEYARAYTQDAVRLGFKGVYRIQQELYAKGVARSFVGRACEEFKGETYDALCQYVDDRNLCEGIETYKDYEKLKAKLIRRGYSSSEIRKCLDRYDLKLKNE